MTPEARGLVYGLLFGLALWCVIAVTVLMVIA